MLKVALAAVEALQLSADIEWPDDLIEQIRAENCILYAGSGLSAPAGLPAWQEFGQQLVRHAFEADLVTKQDLTFYESALADRKTDYVVDEIVGRVPETFLQDFLTATFLGRAPGEAHGVVRDLPFMAALTTNFDDLLEQTFKDRMAVAGNDVMTPQDVDGMLSSLSRRAFFLLKLYGTLYLSFI